MNTQSLVAAAQNRAPQMGEACPAAVSYRTLVTVQEGLHRGAAFVSTAAQVLVVGSDPGCDVVLLDEGVHGKALRLFERDGTLVLDVLSAGVQVAGVDMPVGVNGLMGPVALLRVGAAELRVELLRHRSGAGTEPRTSEPLKSFAGPPQKRLHPLGGPGEARVGGALKSFAGPPQERLHPLGGPGEARVGGAQKSQGLKRRSWAALMLAGMTIAGALTVVGGAVNASSRQAPVLDGRSLTRVVESFNAQGAQMQVVGEAEGEPLVQGLIADALMKERLEQELRDAGLRVAVRVNDVRLMTESLSRLARLAGHPCEAVHRGAGQFECDAGLVDPQVVSELRLLAEQVPGVQSLEVRVQEPEPQQAPAADVTESAPGVPMKVDTPRYPSLPSIRHVVISEHARFAYDGSGRRLRVGDTIDGVKVVGIRFDVVEFMHDRQLYQVFVTPMLASAAGGSVHGMSGLHRQP